MRMDGIERQEHLLTGLDDWAKYVRSASESDPLVQLAIVHAEFEALHPFKDGNGRLGRMIVPLFLYERKLLSGPNFYMSGYLEARRDEYIERMRAISRDGAWTEWCAFFLQGLIEQASENQSKAQAILTLQGDSQERQILAVSGGGRVREFQLRYRVSFRVHDGKGKQWLKSSEVVLVRDLTYDDTAILAKEAEATLLFQNMQSDAVAQVLRRVQAIRPASSAADDNEG